MPNELIGCRTCSSPGCKGCNMFTLYKALNAGKFDALMSDNHTLHDSDLDIFERDRWISVEERLPEHHNWCLVLGENLYDMDFINSRGVWNTHDKPFSPILFWRPLPEPPKEET